MNENKKAELKETIEIFQKELEALKQNDPNGDYEKLERMIAHLNDVLNGVQHKGYVASLFLKLILFTFLIYLSYTLCVGVVFGFGASFINNSNPLRYSWIIPVLALVFLLFHKVIDFAFNKSLPRYPMMSYAIFNFIFVLILAVLDVEYFHITSSLSNALLLFTAITLLTFLSEIYMTRKVYFIL